MRFKVVETLNSAIPCSELNIDVYLIKLHALHETENEG